MKITRIELYGYKLTYAHGEYVMSKGRGATSQDATLVRIITDAGLEGWGENATLAGTYLPAFTGSTRAALQELAPLLIGQDPRNISMIHRIMDGQLLGQANAKSAIDIACWDILGKGRRPADRRLLGGVLQPEFPLYEAVPLDTPQAMADFVTQRQKAGISRFQLKVGNDPYDDAERTRAVVAVADPRALIIADFERRLDATAGRRRGAADGGSRHLYRAALPRDDRLRDRHVQERAAAGARRESSSAPPSFFTAPNTRRRPAR